MSLIVNATAATCPSFDAQSLRWGSATDSAPLLYGELCLAALLSPHMPTPSAPGCALGSDIAACVGWRPAWDAVQLRQPELVARLHCPGGPDQMTD